MAAAGLQLTASLAPLRPKSHFSLTWLVQVRCMFTMMPCFFCDVVERSRVSSLVVPPAPQVKSMNRGSCLPISSMVLCSFSTCSGVRGGKYSKAMNGCAVAAVHCLIMSEILPFLIVGRAPRTSTGGSHSLVNRWASSLLVAASMRLRSGVRARSPRSEPGAALAGSASPSRLSTPAIAEGPDQTIATTSLLVSAAEAAQASP